IARRYPVAELLLFPTRVQGEGAAEEIARQVARANEYRRDDRGLDLLIVGRGGGSLEDLWAFNEEPVARALFDSKIPVISAVGHEVDFTIADFVADLRAPTPTAAAQAAVPDRAELLGRVAEQLRRLVACQRRLLERQELRLQNILRSYAFRLTMKRVEEGFQAIDELGERLTLSIARRLERCRERCDNLVGRLEAANPAAILGRGYAIATAVGTGKVIRSARQVAVGDPIKVQLHRGELLCEVEEAKGG
ncbi:MAG: exodeoxyribonuclease VII large subunit, partial [Candidatus Bipolaricaulia bacterium]